MANSFTADVKNEVAHASNKNACCSAAEIAGFIRACGAVILAGKAGMGLKLATENAAVARRYKSLLEAEYGVSIRLMVGEAAAGRRSHVYELSIQPGKRADTLLTATGIITIEGGNRHLRSGFGEAMMRRKCCRKACLKGLFLGAGTVSDPERGYNLEIVL
ncbi:MAG: DNA-binding protein WhiA, partial [Clostridiales Family XIII bacterium]|nr:DNA-binding protein WhiA [Clostridiales Family XIII bacterium]